MTQTYLSVVQPDAGLFVYYCFEDYDEQQKAYTDTVRSELQKLGDYFASDVALLFPNEDYSAKIAGEVRDLIWPRIRGQMPGLLMTRKPISDISGQDDSSVYLSLPDNDPVAAIGVIKELRRIANADLAHQFSDVETEHGPSWTDVLMSSLEFEVNLGIMKIDLKKIADGLVGRRQ